MLYKSKQINFLIFFFSMNESVNDKKNIILYLLKKLIGK